jgi:hypothetical protein
MKRYHVAGILLVVVLLMSGCSTPKMTISFDGDLDSSVGDFTMRGKIVDEAAGEPNLFENVSVYLYAENGTVLNKTNFRSIDGKSDEFVLTARQRPKYVIIDSPDFWETDGSVDYYVHKEGEVYSQEIVGNKSELPVIHGSTG